MNRFQGIDFASLCSLAGRYDYPIPTRFLVPIDFLKIPAQDATSSLFLVFLIFLWEVASCLCYLIG